MRATQGLAVVLRLFGMGGRFLLIVVAAEFLSESEMGVLGLVLAMVGFLMYCAGMEFYTFSVRRYISDSRDARIIGLVSQISMFSSIHAALALSALLYVWLIEPAHVLLLACIGLVLLEHIAQEANRLLVAVEKPLAASFVLFIRSGSWSLIAVLCLVLWPSSRSLDFVLWMWGCGVLLACIISVYLLRGEFVDWRWSGVDLSWLRLGLVAATPYMISSIASKAIPFLDRLGVKYSDGIEAVGVYSVFASIAGVIVVVVNAGIVDFSSARLVRMASEGHWKSFHMLVGSIKFRSRVTAVGLGVVLVVCCGIGVIFRGRPIYMEYLWLLPCLLIGSTVVVWSMGAHLALYAGGFDRAICSAEILGFLSFLLMVSALFVPFGVPGVVASVIGAGFVSSWWKERSWARLRHSMGVATNSGL